MRDLDAQVAEKVMGWELFVPGTETIEPDWRRDLEHMRNRDAWYPSRSISDAWLVVEEVIKRHPEHDFHLEHLHNQWACGNCTDDVWTYADTAPEAICRAALKVVNG